jgi:murein DD-endopeptidase MepM/ murein hydrolase activator NlpD
MGRGVGRLATILGGALAVLVFAGSSAAEPSIPTSGASARAIAVKIVVPGQADQLVGAVSSPPDGVAYSAGFALPEDGSIVTTGAVTASSSAAVLDETATASASAEVTLLSLFGGELTAERVLGRASAFARPEESSGDLSGAAVAGLVVLGQPVEAAPGQRVPLGDWGEAIVLGEGASPGADGFRGFVAALEVQLRADHGGLPAGSAIVVGYAETAAKTVPLPPAEPEPVPAEPEPPPPPPAPQPEVRPEPEPKARPSTESPPPAAKPAAPRVARKPKVRPRPARPLPLLEPKLTKRGYVFPVHGPASFTDTFGAPRAVVEWHHGEDIFAPFGAPVLAVAKGTVFSVGFNDLGGNRFWLRDEEGNEFYYAHLAAYTPLAANGAHVEAGDVLGFVGNSGDAETTPPHLHFEIHPVGLLGLGYDGAVSPYRYLTAWQRLEDVRFVAGAAWAPPSSRHAPRPGAFLLSATDISTASGLEPGSLRRALADQQPVPGSAPVLP